MTMRPSKRLSAYTNSYISLALAKSESRKYLRSLTAALYLYTFKIKGVQVPDFAPRNVNQSNPNISSR